MNAQEQTAALQEFGYTPREAAFLALAALHSGYFLRRQFCPKRGKLADVLCRKVLARDHARTTVMPATRTCITCAPSRCTGRSGRWTTATGGRTIRSTCAPN